jgi:hypothetical protein
MPETCGHVLGTRAGRRTRERSIVKNDRENEPAMTTYPLVGTPRRALRESNDTPSEDAFCRVACCGQLRATATLKGTEPAEVAYGP